MNSAQDNQDSSFLLAHFYKNLISGKDLNNIAFNLKIIDNLLSTGVSINQKFPDIFLSTLIEPSGVGCTSALHFACSNKIGDLDFISALLDRGADFTLKNSNEHTVVHQLYKDWIIHRDTNNSDFDNLPYINLLLSAHMKYHIISNPINEMGLSHLHIACILNHIEAVTFFLQNGVSVDQAVNTDADTFAGYTSLHFAVEFNNVEVAKILLDYGAKAYLEDVQGLTPFHMLIEDRLSLFSAMLYNREEFRPREKFENNKKFIRLLLEKDHLLGNSILTLCAACSLKDISLVKNLLKHVADINQALSMNSQQWPGYTALHFAALFLDIDTIKLLLENGANILAEDANGETPLSMCFKRYKSKDIYSMLLSNAAWENTLMTDGKTKLLDLVLSMNSIEEFRLFLGKNPDVIPSAIPGNSSFWPGYTLLHLAIAISTSNDIVTQCLNYNIDMNIKNEQGQTAFHLAYRLGKHVSLLVQCLQSSQNVRDVLDKDNLSYLHIACAQKDEQLVEKLLVTSDPNVAYSGRLLKDLIETGSTPLHVAIKNPHENIVKMLVNRGANVNAVDAHGMTPIHCILKSSNRVICQIFSKILFSHAKLKDSTTKFGLNYLHVAALVNSKDAVERLIQMGSNINAIVNYEKNLYPKILLPSPVRIFKFTPLDFALKTCSYKAFIALAENGAKMRSDHFKSDQPLRNIDPDLSMNSLATYLCYNGDIEKYTERDMGFTRLHAASYEFRIDIVNKFLRQGLKVNAQIHVDSKFFPGCTPLHLFMMKMTKTFSGERGLDKMISTIQFFLDKGADVTLTNVKGDTPIHLAFKFVDKKGCSSRYPVNGAEKLMNLLMTGTKDFSTNPINGDGISHFHVACLDHNIDAVEEFLQHGVDVNQPTGLSNANYAKCTPLHLAFKFPLTKFKRNQSPSTIVNLLLEYGADIHAVDTRGNTPLHEACRDARANVGILSNLINSGADIKKENLHGQTPFEILLSSPDALPEQIKLFIRKGCRLNDSNRLSEKGYIGIFVFANAEQSQENTLGTIMKFTNETARDKLDRTAIHNTVAVSKTTKAIAKTYCNIIDWFLKKGIDIDHQDRLGKTALHYAAQFGNTEAILALLELGVDMKIIDETGKSALSYALERSLKMDEYNPRNRLLIEIRTRQIIGLENNPIDDNIMNDLVADTETSFDCWISQFEGDIKRVIEMSKNINVGSGSVMLHDFLSDKKIVLNYATMAKKDREEIDNYFNSLDGMEFSYYEGYVSSLFISQYKIAVARLYFLEEAAHSLRSLLGFSFPGLCEEILAYLSKAELKKLIRSVK